MQINIRHLKAANIFASHEKTRYYINGVLLEIKNGVLNLVATDGHRLIKFSQTTDALDGQYIIPRQLIDRIKLPTKGDALGEIEVEGLNISITYNGDTFKGQLVDGTFPPYERIIPNVADYEVAQGVNEIGFNASYLGDFAKVNKALGYGGMCGIKMTMCDKGGPVIIESAHKHDMPYLAVLMPVRF